MRAGSGRGHLPPAPWSPDGRGQRKHVWVSLPGSEREAGARSGRDSSGARSAGHTGAVCSALGPAVLRVCPSPGTGVLNAPGGGVGWRPPTSPPAPKPSSLGNLELGAPAHFCDGPGETAEALGEAHGQPLERAALLLPGPPATSSSPDHLPSQPSVPTPCPRPS